MVNTTHYLSNKNDRLKNAKDSPLRNGVNEKQQIKSQLIIKS